MALDSKHPSYSARLADWRLMRHAYEGERAVKEAGETYLPATPAQRIDGMLTGQPGRADYDAYKLRAVFPDSVSDAVENYIGLLHQKDAAIELPEALEPLREKASNLGESLQSLLRRINEQQLATGRLGALLDMPEKPDPTAPLPYIALYTAEAVTNWDDSNDWRGKNALSLVVLDETTVTRDAGYEWQAVARYRVLELQKPPVPEGVDPLEWNPPPDTNVYVQGLYEARESANTADPAKMLAPTYRGATLNKVPFVFINSKDTCAEPDNPPLMGLGRLCMSIYRGEADYRYTLFMQSQETFVTVGTVQNKALDGTGLRIGAGAHVELDLQGDAKYVGISASGLTEQRTSIENDQQRANSRAGVLISPTAGKQESGDALSTRLAAQTASLVQIAKAGAAGLETLLRIAAEWVGADPGKVKVTPNTEFTPVLLTGQEVAQLMAARTMGAPLSLESIHGVFVNRRLTTLSYEDELEKIAEEDMARAKRAATLPAPPAPPTLPGSPAPQPPGPQKRQPPQAE